VLPLPCGGAESGTVVATGAACVPVAVVVGVVVFLLLMAAVCGVIAIWTILHDLRGPGPAAPWVEWHPSILTLPRPVQLPPPLPRGFVEGSMMPMIRDDDDDDDYTEVDDGVTIIRERRAAARR
jgi:hypothetical protein